MALGEVKITGTTERTVCTVVNCVQWRLTQGGPLGLYRTLFLLMFQFLLHVQGFMQASLVA